MERFYIAITKKYDRRINLNIFTYSEQIQQKEFEEFLQCK